MRQRINFLLPNAKHNKLQDYRVLILDHHALCPTEAVVSKAINGLAARLINCGVNVSRSSPHLPDLTEIARNYSSLLSAWSAANIPTDIYVQMQTAAKQLSDDDNSLAAYYLRGSVMSHREWLIATKTRDQLHMQWKKIYDEFDVVLCPAMPTVAFPHDHSPNPDARRILVDGVQVPYWNQYVWVCIANLFGLPATSAPIDQTDNGLPIGVQIIGDYLQDYTTIKFANLLEREFGGFSIPNL